MIIGPRQQGEPKEWNWSKQAGLREVRRMMILQGMMGRTDSLHGRRCPGKIAFCASPEHLGIVEVRSQPMAYEHIKLIPATIALRPGTLHHPLGVGFVCRPAFLFAKIREFLNLRRGHLLPNDFHLGDVRRGKCALAPFRTGIGLRTDSLRNDRWDKRDPVVGGFSRACLLLRWFLCGVLLACILCRSSVRSNSAAYPSR